MGLAMVVAIAASACSRRDQNWAKATAAATQHATTYPGFKAVLEAQTAARAKAMAEAESIKDSAKRDAAIAKALENSGTVVALLDEVKDKSDAIDTSIAELSKLGPSTDSNVQQVLNVARARHLEISKTLSQAAPANEEQALQTLQPALGTLNSIKGKLARAAALAARPEKSE